MANKLPQETPAFTGKAERLIAQSTPRKLARQSAPEGAPNIVLILLDDVGFGSFGTFGGPVPTPTLDRIASLTLRELELFRLLALGKTVSYCAKVMNLNEKTVYNRQTKIREKLQVDTLAGMVHLAQRHQIIDSNVMI